jgi:hypothetical protein
MDYPAARDLLIRQGAIAPERPDNFLPRLSQGLPPVPGQVTSILLALKVVFDRLREETTLERDLACALYILTTDSRHYYNRGRSQGVDWPPLLDEDLDRMAIAVRSIFTGSWQGNSH